MSFIGTPALKTQLRLSSETLIQNYVPAAKEWSFLIERKDAMHGDGEPTPPLEQNEKDLADWLAETKLEDGEEGGEAKAKCRHHPKVHSNNVALYACSWCGNPSAVLRKCAGCGNTR